MQAQCLAASLLYGFILPCLFRSQLTEYQMSVQCLPAQVVKDEPPGFKPGANYQTAGYVPSSKNGSRFRLSG